MKNKNFLKWIIAAVITITVITVVIIILKLPREETESSGNIESPEITGNLSEVAIPSVKLEDYNEDFFSIKKPIGWDIKIGGSCSTFSFVIRDKENPTNMIFYFGEIGPVYLSEEQKTIDKEYMDMGGYQILWYEMPVVKPLTAENFLKNMNLISKTSFIKNFMTDIPEINDVEILTSSEESSVIQGETKLMRALFSEQGKLGEGLFYITVNSVLPENGMPAAGIGYGFSFIGITGDKDEFRFLEEQLLESINSFTLSESYVSNCLQQQTQTTQGILKAGKTLSETSDIIMEEWENRNKVDDIISEKRSDVILGRERVYNQDTGYVYYMDNGWYDDYNINREKYDMDRLEKLPENSWEFWNAPAANGEEYIH